MTSQFDSVGASRAVFARYYVIRSLLSSRSAKQMLRYWLLSEHIVLVVRSLSFHGRLKGPCRILRALARRLRRLIFGGKGIIKNSCHKNFTLQNTATKLA